MLRSELRNSSDAYIVIKAKITVKSIDNANRRNKEVALKNNAPFSHPYIINNTFVDSSYLYIAIPMHNLLKYSDNYFMTSRVL